MINSATVLGIRLVFAALSYFLALFIWSIFIGITFFTGLLPFSNDDQNLSFQLLTWLLIAVSFCFKRIGQRDLWANTQWGMNISALAVTVGILFGILLILSA